MLTVISSSVTGITDINFPAWTWILTLQILTWTGLFLYLLPRIRRYLRKKKTGQSTKGSTDPKIAEN
jgi:hypothetical protein